MNNGNFWNEGTSALGSKPSLQSEVSDVWF